MKVYRIKVSLIAVGFLLVVIFSAISIVIREWRGFWFVALLGLGVFSELTTRIVVSAEELLSSVSLLPFLPPWRRTIRWVDIIEVRASQNIAFVEADALLIVGRQAASGRQYLRIPIVLLRHRHEFLRELTSNLPSHVSVPDDLRRWAETVGTTPRWQLIIALGIIGVLLIVLWLSH